MSWEQMRSDTRPCPCGKGTITYCMDMDDWNRFRHYQIIDCAKCQAEADKRQRLESERERRRESLLAKAVQIAERRYLVRWLAMYEGKNKKAAWLIYTGGAGYPALGTFYRHVKFDGGVEQYLRRSFSHDFQKALAKMKVKDTEIEELLAERAGIAAPSNNESF